LEKEKITVSVVIPAYSLNRLQDTMKVIESIYAQTVTPDEVIVAVDHNEDLVTALRALTNNSVVVEENNGVIGGAEARNVGIRKATGDVVAFIDDDAWAVENWLESLLAHYRNEDVMAVGGRTISTWDEGRPRWFPEELDWIVGGTWKGHPEESCEVRNLVGPNMSFRRALCDEVGYFRPELGALGTGFRAGDETEFYMRMKHHSPTKKILFEPKALVYHKVYKYKVSVSQLCLRSFNLGYYKSKKAKVLANSHNRPFATERNFLKYLLLRSVPRRILKGQLGSVSSIILSIVLCGIGFMAGRIVRE